MEKRRLRKENLQKQKVAKEKGEAIPPDLDLSDDDEEIVAELEKKAKICDKSKSLQSEEDLLSTLSLLESMHRAQKMVCKL